MELQRYTLPRSRFNSISPNSYGTFFKADEAESIIAEKDQRIKELEAVNLAKDRLILAKKAENQRLREALIERDGGSHDSDCKIYRMAIRKCTCGHDLAQQALNEESKP